MRNYRALSIKQPWLAAILSGWKPVENRTWDTSYRGPLLLHASARIDPDGFDVIRRMDYFPLGSTAALFCRFFMASMCSL